MKTSQKRAIWYADRKRKVNKFNEFIETNNINLKELGLDKVKYLEIKCRRLRALGYDIWL